MFIIYSHVLYNNKGEEIHGPTHDFVNFLKSRNPENIIIFKHSLNFGFQSKIEKKDNIVNKVGIFYKVPILSFIEPIIINLIQTKSFSDLELICIDPINGLSGAILKKIKKVKKLIYFSPDYADDRFSNKILNKIYHMIDMFALKNADEIWAVSSRIIKKRIEQGVNPKILFLVPNSPNLDQIHKQNYDGNHDLVIVSNLSRSLNIDPVLESLDQLTKKYKNIRLKIIGSGEEENKIRQKVEHLHLDSNVLFLGRLDHDKVIAELLRSFIGFALYTDKSSWNYYGDSMKAREYVACGLPVIINDLPSTADDIREAKAGIVLTQIKPDLIVKFVERCINDKAYYQTLRDNAIDLGIKFDKKKVLYELFSH